MRLVIRTVLASVVVLPLGILTTAGDAMSVEKLAYRTIEQDGRFELRMIEPHVVAETFVEGDFEEVGSEGFRRLVDYIGGANRSQDQISMTAPVAQQPASEKIAMTAPVVQERVGKRQPPHGPSHVEIDLLPGRDVVALGRHERVAPLRRQLPRAARRPGCRGSPRTAP